MVSVFHKFLIGKVDSRNEKLRLEGSERIGNIVYDY